MRFLRPCRWLVVGALWLATAAAADVPVPVLKARVTDQTATLSADQRLTLESELQALETRTGAQIAVLLVPTTQPETIEQYSIRVAEAWKLGKKGVDNGLLVLVAKKDRKVRLEVGYGLEGVIPDAIARRVIDETITPRFKQSDFAGGLSSGIQRLAALIEGRPTVGKVAESAPAAAPPTETHSPLRSGNGPVIDLTETLPEEQRDALSRRLRDFYDSGRTKPIFVVIVPTTKPDTPAQYAVRLMNTWASEDNLDIDRSILLLIARDEALAHIEAGAGLRQRLLPGAAEHAVSAVIGPPLRQGKLPEAVESGVQELEALVDAAIKNKTFTERLIENVSEVPLWLLVALVIVGTAIRWFLGPLFGGLVFGGLVGSGAWFVSETIEIAIGAGVIGFIFVLVGLANWIGMALSGGSGGSSSGGGGFSGGGGGFGGGGASGSW